MSDKSNRELYYTFWQLALENPSAAERWRVENEVNLSFWSDMPMVFPGFYRQKYGGHRFPELRGTMIPVAIWIESPRDADGSLVDDEYVVLRTANWKSITQVTGDYQEATLTMSWAKCRDNPVTYGAYTYAMEHKEKGKPFVWADSATLEAKMNKAPIKLTERTFFK